ncbi:anti-sigma regulatory factor (Ser/Thr protein kinase) [Streptomyces sp. V3I8]|uniref:ATP-binding protein n=1 Tax=Streptomyces sp. V3I8 TaxID=3042279 RepID=UPI00278A8FD6|nr:ATP-binding protein [Streptomyces sp. V3I8]MDQ1039925.1 anti-sigma regulatory factor (Ser/Thr protein kinase) [Streptomyces sp. V3I8]
MATTLTARQPANDKQMWLHVWDRLTLAAVPSAASCARALTTALLRWWGSPQVLDDALLVVSELVTNAVNATGPDTSDPKWSDVKAEHVLGVQLRLVDMSLFIEVWDRSLAAPEMREQSAEAESGRGLLLVEALAKNWGTFRPPAGGKIMWAELALTEPPTFATKMLPLQRRSPRTGRTPQGRVKEQIETALMQRVLDGLHKL